MMRIIGLVIALVTMIVSPVAATGCTTQSYMVNGRMVVCTICPGMTLCN